MFSDEPHQGIDGVNCSVGAKETPLFRGVNPKMLSSGEFYFYILYIISACSSSLFREIFG